MLKEVDAARLLVADEKELDITFHVDKNLPYLLKGDLNKISTILSNLLSNAVKYTSKGIIKCRCALACKYEDYILVDFTITDTGCGIPIEAYDRVYDLFYRALPSYQTNISGLGIGLFIVKNYVDLLGGDIWFDSELSKGTTFSVTLPFYKCDGQGL